MSGKSTVLEANYFPAIDLSDGDYESSDFWDLSHERERIE